MHTHGDLSHEQFRELLDCSPDCVVSIDFGYAFTYANQPAMDLLGVPNVVGETLFELFPGNLVEPFHSTYINAMEHRVPGQFEAFYPAPLDRWLKVTARPVLSGMLIFFHDIGDRKRAEILRDEATQQLQQVFDVTEDAIAGLDREFRYTFLNRRAHELLHTKPNLIGKCIWDEFPAAAAPGSDYWINYRKTMEERVVTHFEAYYAEPLNLHLSIECRPSDEGIIIFFRDITARKRSQEALAASEERYRILADLNPQAIWMGAPDGSITYANQGFLDYIGLTLESLDGLGWLAAFHPDDRDAVVAAWTHSVQTGDEYNLEARITRARDSVSRLWWLRGLPVRDEAGAILHWLGVAMDIDDIRSSAEALERKQQETERQRAELETIYQTAGIGLSLLSPDDFRVLRINDRQADILGLPPEQIIGRPIAEIAPSVSDVEVIRTAAKGTPVRDLIVEGELPARPGENRFFAVSYTPVYASDGTVQAITASSLDITQQKRAEAALVQSEKLAAVGRLASSISHEINNPLEAITNLLYLIALSENLPQDLKVYVHMAQSELSRVSQIATQTLRFHRQAAKPTLITPGELVDAVLNLYQGRLANSGIKVDLRYDTQTRILCFENDIRQVLNNLIANAIDAMRKGGRLIARAHDAHEPGTNRPGVRITIADTGHGMSPVVLARVFEPFYTTKDLNGTGLGLWISQGIVERHQGTLAVRSSEDPIHHGTIFSLFLPCEETPADSPNPANLYR